MGGVQDGRSSERGDFPGVAGRPRHWLLLWPGQPRGGLAAGLPQPQLTSEIQIQIQKQDTAKNPYTNTDKNSDTNADKTIDTNTNANTDTNTDTNTAAGLQPQI